jgi:hypothetical protein
MKKMKRMQALLSVAVTLSLAAFVCLTLPRMVQAAPARKIKAQPFISDPTGSGLVSAAWVAHEGLPDAGKSNHALRLRKNGPTLTNAAAGAVIVGVSGLAYDPKTFVVGFAYNWIKGWCGTNAPRFEIQFAGDPKTYRLGCADGTLVELPAVGWRQITFDSLSPATDGNGASVNLPDTPQTILSISVVFDDGKDATDGSGIPGIAFLDNIQILNFPPIGKSGYTKPFKPKK